MSKDPAFLWYPNDYLGGTMGMTFEEKGAYVHLLMMQFNRGHMTSHMVGQEVGQIWDKLQDKFTQDKDGLWYNARLDVEIKKRQAFVKSRYNNLEGINQYTKKREEKAGHKDGHMTSHMENENNSKYSIEELLKKREIEFRQLVYENNPLKYPQELLEKFCEYWTEPNRSRTKMRFELEKVFDIGRRLATWAGRDKEMKGKNGSPISDIQSAPQYSQRLRDIK